MNTRDEIASEAETARAVNMSLSGFRKMRASGRGPRHIRLGRIIRYRRSDVDAWLEQNTREPLTNEEGKRQ